MHKSPLSSMHLDALNEIGNIGAGNATTALCQLTNQHLLLSVPHAQLVPMQELPLLAEGDPEDTVVAAYVAFGGDAEGCLLALFSEPQARTLIELLGLPSPQSVFALPDLDRSAVSEVGNIMVSTYLTALAQVTGLSLTPAPPGVAVGMSGAVLGSIAAHLGQLDNCVLVVHLHIAGDSRGLGLRLFMIPQLDSLATILAAMGLPALR